MVRSAVKALDLRGKLLPGDHPDIALAQNNLAALYHDLGRHDEAITAYQQSAKLALRRQFHGTANPIRCARRGGS